MPRLPYPKTVDLNCENCRTLHTDVPVEGDEDGFFADLDAVPCEDPDCTKKLCSICPQFTCECGGHFCFEPSHIGQEIEPECTCVQIDVDRDDARGCELHGHYPRPTIYFCRTCAAPAEEVTEAEPVTVGFEAAFAQMKEVA